MSSVTTTKSLDTDGESPAETSQDYGIPQPSVITELSRQLDDWRSSLPRAIQWTDDELLGSFDCNSGQQVQDTLPLSEKIDISDAHGTILDILIARLRTRFYHVRYVIYRPYVYKALHFPEQMSPEDIDKCAMCLKVCPAKSNS